jgi:hypothetical protein
MHVSYHITNITIFTVKYRSNIKPLTFRITRELSERHAVVSHQEHTTFEGVKLS